jgi:hypothetical protein
MSVPKVICDRKTRDKLGEDGLAAVRSRLYAVDCQTCGHPLGTDPPALVVHDVDEWAQADLHHRGCRAAEWNDGTVFELSGGNTVTWHAMSALFPAPTTPGKTASVAMLIVNPSLEAVFLYPEADGWRPGYNAFFSAAGLAPSPDSIALTNRIAPGVTAQAGDAEITAVLKQPAPNERYFAPAAPQTVAAARAYGFLLVVTHALDPSELESADARTAILQTIKVIQHGDAIIGWAAPQAL